MIYLFSLFIVFVFILHKIEGLIGTKSPVCPSYRADWKIELPTRQEWNKECHKRRRRK